ncbi:hypothetical protein CFOL_v3_10330 [Cephalotus follicularis]|uniref:DUF7870 domain-containing protein n=1 Tax=Cephalotus follicularis TaxID=3775 RepID=A0A1Q3BFP7_CEPFO|nr:hypothetical protein CFOL_v3_10330 [Cephalotus follicularis]
MAIQMIQGFPGKCHNKKLKILENGGIGLQTDTYLIIKLHDSWVLRLLARSFLLALFIVSLPWLGSILGGSSNTNYDSAIDKAQVMAGSDPVHNKLLPLLFRDLSNEGLLKFGDKALFICNGEKLAFDDPQILNEKDTDFISISDVGQQESIPNESFDFILTSDFNQATEFIDRTLRIGGIAVVKLSENPSFGFNKPSNYKIVYMRRFSTMILAMKKTNYAEGNKATQRKLFGYASEAKKAALKNLEDVLLEPPRAASGRSSRYLKRTRFLPNLMGDSLESYPRRVFIDVGLPERDGGSGTRWFAKNYPTRNLNFDVYNIETVTEESSGKEVPQLPEIGMSNWLRKNVKEDEFVVMKAEAEVVEEMVKSKAIELVDELFLECKPQGHNGKGINGSRRAYWECLALYGKLRDEGVAVHQWWG